MNTSVTWRILRGLYEYECDMENIEGLLRIRV